MLPQVLNFTRFPWFMYIMNVPIALLKINYFLSSSNCFNGSHNYRSFQRKQELYRFPQLGAAVSMFYRPALLRCQIGLTCHKLLLQRNKTFYLINFPIVLSLEEDTTTWFTLKPYKLTHQSYLTAFSFLEASQILYHSSRWLLFYKLFELIQNFLTVFFVLKSSLPTLSIQQKVNYSITCFELQFKTT